jgi:tryptophan synthase alpha subunit
VLIPGVPFSDPIADGPTIQESSFFALQNGIDIPACLEYVQEVNEAIQGRNNMRKISYICATFLICRLGGVA